MIFARTTSTTGCVIYTASLNQSSAAVHENLLYGITDIDLRKGAFSIRGFIHTMTYQLMSTESKRTVWLPSIEPINLNNASKGIQAASRQHAVR